MDTVTSTQAKQEFGEVIMRSQVAPVSVTKNGKPVVVILSETEYQTLKRQSLRSALIEGELSGEGGELNMDSIKAQARKKIIDASHS